MFPRTSFSPILQRCRRAAPGEAVVSLAFLLLGAAPSQAAKYEVVSDPNDKANLVKFTSKAPLDSFDGKTRLVRGTIELDLADVSEVKIEITVDMASLDTGIGMRNTHMRENHLDTEEFPTAVFRGGAVVEGAGADLTDGEPHDIVLEGKIDLHGVVKQVRVPVQFRHEAGALHLESRFPVALSDHDIKRPRFLVMQLADVQEVSVVLVARPAGAGGTTE